jgi:hypothetical protein
LYPASIWAYGIAWARTGESVSFGY